MGADYINDGCDEDVVLNCAAGLSLLPNKLQATEAAHVVEQLGEKNLLKVPLVSLDCAAEGVGKLISPHRPFWLGLEKEVIVYL